MVRMPAPPGRRTRVRHLAGTRPFLVQKFLLVSHSELDASQQRCSMAAPDASQVAARPVEGRIEPAVSAAGSARKDGSSPALSRFGFIAGPQRRRALVVETNHFFYDFAYF